MVATKTVVRIDSEQMLSNLVPEPFDSLVGLRIDRHFVAIQQRVRKGF